MKHFLWMIHDFGLKIALDYYVIAFCKWFVGARSIRLAYDDEARDSERPVVPGRQPFQALLIDGKHIAQ